MHNEKTTARQNWIDGLKGIGIALVILGHAARHDMMADSDLCGIWVYWIYSFHMPLYFAISGYTFGLSYRKYLDKPAAYLSRRARGLLIPMLTFSCGIYLCFFAVWQIPALAQVLHNASYELYPFGKYLGLMLLGGNPYSIHLWYLWVLFWMIAVSFLWLRQGKDSPAAWKGLLALAVLCFVTSTVTELPAVIQKFLCFYIYFVLGMLLSKSPEKLPAIPGFITALGWGVLLVNAPIVRENLLKGVPWAMLVQKYLLLAAVPVVIVYLFRLAQRLPNNRLFLWLGRESYAIYLLHQPLCAFAGMLLYGKMGLPVWPVYLICVALSIVFPELVVWLCRKVKPIGSLAKNLLNIR